MQSDEIAYLDQLYEQASKADTETERARSRRRFMDNVWMLWPEISATFDEHKHSL
jgi:hypothetical protein